MRLRVEATIRGERAERSTSAAPTRRSSGNLNCPLSVTKSAAFFAVRVLTDPDAPPCAGAYRPIEVIAPEGCLLNARSPAAVAAGNVETSSRVADLVIAALGGARPVPAQGQGTMNNLTLADEEFTYYETLGGGQGACPDADGPERDPRRDVEHAQHPGRGTGERVPAARPRALAAPRQRRRGRAPRRRRDRARDRGARADALLADQRAPPPPAARPRRRRGRRPRPQPPQRRAAARQGEGELAPGDTLRIETPGGGGHGSQ